MAWQTKKTIGGKDNKGDNQLEDYCIPSPPSDGISCISVNSNSNMMILTSWDNTVSCYELVVAPTGKVNQATPKAQIRHDSPVLCSEIAPDGVTVFSAGCDRTVKMWNPTQGTTTQTIGQHDQPIRSMRFVPSLNVLVTGSWDKTVRVWDCRQPTPAMSITLNERVHCMDVKGEAMVVGTADKNMHVFNVADGFKKLAEYQSPLAFQTRTVSIFNDRSGYAIGCIEGRVAVEYFSEMGKKGVTPTAKDPKSLNFVFKCHRQKRDEATGNTDIYSVNDIAFHPLNTFCTAGSDGTLALWDKDSKNRLKSFDRFRGVCPISCCTFNAQGTLLFYAVSYDWSRGVEHNNPAAGNNVYIHHTKPDEIQPKPKK